MREGLERESAYCLARPLNARPKPALLMKTSAAIADPLLRRAFGRRACPADPHRTVGDWRPSFWRLSPSEDVMNDAG